MIVLFNPVYPSIISTCHQCKNYERGLPWRSRGDDPALPLQEAQVPIPGRGTKIPRAVQRGQKVKIKTKNYEGEFTFFLVLNL